MIAMPKKIKVILSTVLMLLLFTTTAFASNPFTSKSTIVDQASGGYIKLTIYRNHPDDSTPFSVKNMFPGDVETKDYFLAVSYRGSITVHFHADIRPGYEKLAEVLKCKVVLLNNEEILYDGLMRDMPASIEHELVSSGKTTDELTYEITTYLETSVGNEYMAKELVADFCWWAVAQEISKDNSYEPDNSDVTTKPTQSTEHDMITDIEETTVGEEAFVPGELVNPPKTGDVSFVPTLIMFVGSLTMLLILLFGKRRKEDENEQ